MNISSGLSQISTNPAEGKVYLWPKYNAGIVDAIKPAGQQKSHEIFRADPAEREKLIEKASAEKIPVYNNRAELTGIRFSSIAPGSLFDAFA